MGIAKRIMERLAVAQPVTGPSSAVQSRVSRIETFLQLRTAGWAQPALVALAYFFGAEAAFYIGTLSDQIFALFWPPNVVLFCALLLVPYRDWWLYIAAVLPAHVLAELGVGMAPSQLSLAFATNCAAAVLSACGVREFVGGPPWFGNLRKASIYILVAAGICPALAALGGAFVPIVGGGPFSQYWIFYGHWYLANALPNLTLGPVFLIWFSDRDQLMRWKPARRHMEPIALGLALVAICLITTTIAERLTANSFLPTVLLLPLPAILWAAVRFGEKGASAAILIIAIILTWRTLHDGGLFPGENAHIGVLALQSFLTGLSIPILLLGVLIDERRRSERARSEIAGMVVRAQEEERRRIARDLHDSTGQNLIAGTLIASRLESSLPQAAQSDFRRIEEILHQSVSELRTVSYLLHPPLLDDAGLGLALRNFVEGFADRTGILVSLEISDIGRLAPEIELVLFRVVQEALTNIARHSQSETASLRLERNNEAGGDKVVLVVEDAGRGIQSVKERRLAMETDGWSKSPGVGLASMRERLQHIGGHLEIRSAHGTALIVTVPLHVRPSH